MCGTCSDPQIDFSALKFVSDSLDLSAAVSLSSSVFLGPYLNDSTAGWPGFPRSHTLLSFIICLA